jgi:hypothetical protein
LVAVREWLRVHFSAALLADAETTKAIVGVPCNCFITQTRKVAFVSRKYPLDDLPFRAGWKIVYPNNFEEIAAHVVDALPEDEDSRFTLGVDPAAAVVLVISIQDMIGSFGLDWAAIRIEEQHMAELRSALGLQARPSLPPPGR